MAKPGIRGIGKARKKIAEKKQRLVKKSSNLAKIQVVVAGVSYPNINI